ncbi:putative membrane protein [Deinococcus metalli]|uniref:Putative membrane protein n=1 Tax=Deinococcus metalli TaxID=1141878 RepID=A0A7W8KIC1_9DEIO|nr:hypothetical protein [Deinococcus metalli]MBB5378717.1 putative membrane protein [Deinococcus metalli]GHF60455.1 hypothetical protein GCM10017781_40810 [Deinococcus metalli]
MTTSPTPPLSRRRQWLRQAWRAGRRTKRVTALAVTRFLRIDLWRQLAQAYTWMLTLVALFAGFWVVGSVYLQLSDPKQAAIKIFPGGLNDAAALIPLALAGFAALLFSAQGGAPSGTPRHREYGLAARRLLLAVYYLGLSFILGTGSRIMQDGSFTGWTFDWFLNRLAGMLPAVMYLNALIALVLILAGLKYFIRTILNPR